MKERLSHIIIESVLICIGILIAFWVDRYKNSLIDQEVKVQLYKSLRYDLKKDSVNYRTLRSGILIQKKRIADLKRLSNQPDQKDSLTILLYQLETEFIDGGQYRFYDNTDTYSNIISSDQLRSFQLDTTFSKLRDYYVRRRLFDEGVRAYRVYSTSTLTPYFDKYFDRTCVGYLSDTSEVIAILRKPSYDKNQFRSREFLNILTRLNEALMFIPALDSYARNCEKNLNRIDRELVLAQ
jgi:hypothetical protein